MTHPAPIAVTPEAQAALDRIRARHERRLGRPLEPGELTEYVTRCKRWIRAGQMRAMEETTR